jgi:hypothetical protein
MMLLNVISKCITSGIVSSTIGVVMVLMLLATPPQPKRLEVVCQTVVVSFTTCHSCVIFLMSGSQTHKDCTPHTFKPNQTNKTNSSQSKSAVVRMIDNFQYLYQTYTKFI